MRETDVERVRIESFDGTRRAWGLTAYPWLGKAWLVLGTADGGCDAHVTVRMDIGKLRLLAEELARLADDMERCRCERRESDGRDGAEEA